MTKEEKTMKSERVYEGKVINLRVDTVELPDRKYSKREIVEHAGAVAIVAVNPEGKLLLIKQFRKPVEEVLLEIPAGRIEPNENPEHTALRELEEETGFKANKIEKLVQYYSTPGFSNEILHIYLAQELEAGIAKPDEDEYIETFPMTLEEAMDKIKAGEIKDSKAIIGILMYYRYHVLK